MAKSNKFTTLLESYMRRNQRGGFLVGDVFKFKDNFKNEDGYKDLGDIVKASIDSMIDSGLHIRVINIKDTSPARYPASDQTSSLDVVLDIALDTGGGRYTDQCSIPGGLGSCEQYAPNLLLFQMSSAVRVRLTLNLKRLMKVKRIQQTILIGVMVSLH